MADFRAFVDESADDPCEPSFVMTVWAATVQNWETFSDDWAIELARSPAIQYFSHNDAFGLKGPFEGWKESARDEKIYSLISVLCKHRKDIYGVVVTLRHSVFSSIIDQCVFDRRKLHKATRLAFPYHVAFQQLLAEICKCQGLFRSGASIDFIFDERTGFLDECIAVQRRLRRDGLLPQQFIDIVGSIGAGNDKQILPLQASDLLAGQVAAAFRQGSTPPFLSRIQNNIPEIFVSEITAHNSLLLDLDAIVKIINAVQSTYILGFKPQ